jgi:hypothetical protein
LKSCGTTNLDYNIFVDKGRATQFSDNSSNLCRNSKTGLSNSRGYLTKCVTIENTCKLLNGFLFFAQKNVLFFIARSLHLLGSKNTTPEILSNG